MNLSTIDLYHTRPEDELGSFFYVGIACYSNDTKKGTYNAGGLHFSNYPRNRPFI